MSYSTKHLTFFLPNLLSIFCMFPLFIRSNLNVVLGNKPKAYIPCIDGIPLTGALV